MRIELTRDRSRDPSPVLKTGPATRSGGPTTVDYCRTPTAPSTNATAHRAFFAALAGFNPGSPSTSVATSSRASSSAGAPLNPVHVSRRLTIP